MNADSLLRLLTGLREYLPLLIFLVVVPVTMYVSYRSRMNNARKLRELAAKLGLQYQASGQPGEMEQEYAGRIQTYRGGDRIKAEQAYRGLQRSGFLKTLLTLTQPLAVSGRYNGCQVEIKLMNQNKKNFTEASAQFAEPLGIGLRISKSGFWSQKVSLSKSSRVESGNHELDKAVSVAARDELRAKYIVKNFQAQQALLALFGHKGAELTDQGTAVRLDGHQTDYAKTKKLLDDMTRALQAVSVSLGREEGRRE